MKLTVTGTVKEFPEGTTIAQLIAAENVETPDYVTVSVNDAFAQNDAFATTTLHDGDTVEFLYFMGCGR